MLQLLFLSSVLVKLAEAFVYDFVGGCPLGFITDFGFNVNFYRPPLGDNAALNSDGSINQDFFSGNFKKYVGLFGTATNVLNIDFTDINQTIPEVESSDLYGLKTTGSNFTLEFTGYFMPTQTGLYTFELQANDMISLQIGRGKGCCGNFANDIVTQDYQFTKSSNNAGSGISSLMKMSYSVYLTDSKTYPIRLVYYNASGAHVLKASVTFPDGYKTQYWDVNQVTCKLHSITPEKEPWTGKTAPYSNKSDDTKQLKPHEAGSHTHESRSWAHSHTGSLTSTGLSTSGARSTLTTEIMTAESEYTLTASAHATTLHKTSGTALETHFTTGPYTSNGETGIITTIEVHDPSAPGALTTQMKPSGTNDLFTTVESGPYTTAIDGVEAVGIMTTILECFPTAPVSTSYTTKPGYEYDTFTWFSDYSFIFDGLLRVGELVVIDVFTPPAPELIFTITRPGQGQEITTKSQYAQYTAEMNGDIKTGTVLSIFIETPTASGLLTTVNSPCSVVCPATYTNTGPYTITTNGKAETGIVTSVVVDTPTASGEDVTVMTSGAAAFPTTYATTGSYTITTRGLVETGIATSVIIDTPTASAKEITKMTSGAAAFPTTYTSTGPYTITTEGLVETGTLASVIVNTPTASAEDATETTPNFATYPTTYTTIGLYTIFTNGLVETGFVTSVIVDFPTASGEDVTVKTPDVATFPKTFTNTGSCTITTSGLVETGIVTSVTVDTPTASAKDFTMTISSVAAFPTTYTTTGLYTITTDGLAVTGIVTSVIVDTQTASAKDVTDSTLGSAAFPTNYTTTGPYTITTNGLVETGIVTSAVIDTPTAPGGLSTVMMPGSVSLSGIFTTKGPYNITVNGIPETRTVTSVISMAPKAKDRRVDLPTELGSAATVYTVTEAYTISIAGSIEETGLVHFVHHVSPSAQALYMTSPKTVPGSIVTTVQTTGPYTIVVNGTLTEIGVATSLIVESPTAQALDITSPKTVPGSTTAILETTGFYTTFVNRTLTEVGVATSFIIETPTPGALNISSSRTVPVTITNTSETIGPHKTNSAEGRGLTSSEDNSTSTVTKGELYSSVANKTETGHSSRIEHSPTAPYIVISQPVTVLGAGNQTLTSHGLYTTIDDLGETEVGSFAQVVVEQQQKTTPELSSGMVYPKKSPSLRSASGKTRGLNRNEPNWISKTALATVTSFGLKSVVYAIPGTLSRNSTYQTIIVDIPLTRTLGSLRHAAQSTSTTSTQMQFASSDITRSIMVSSSAVRRETGAKRSQTTSVSEWSKKFSQPVSAILSTCVGSHTLKKLSLAPHEATRSSGGGISLESSLREDLATNSRESMTNSVSRLKTRLVSSRRDQGMEIGETYHNSVGSKWAESGIKSAQKSEANANTPPTAHSTHPNGALTETRSVTNVHENEPSSQSAYSTEPGAKTPTEDSRSARKGSGSMPVSKTLSYWQTFKTTTQFSIHPSSSASSKSSEAPFSLSNSAAPDPFTRDLPILVILMTMTSVMILV